MPLTKGTVPVTVTVLDKKFSFNVSDKALISSCCSLGAGLELVIKGLGCFAPSPDLHG